MERLMPVPNFQWVVRSQDVSDFSVFFPTSGELQRSIKVGAIQVPGTSLHIRVEEWTSASIAAFQFQRAWVRIGNIPDDLFNYRAIWGLGSLLGTTIEVDMPFSRQHEVGCICVDVTNKRAIPPGTDLGHKGVGYRLTFQVESSADSDMGEDISSNDDGKDYHDDNDMLDDMKDLDNRKDDDTRKRSRPTQPFQPTEGVTEPSSAPPAFNAGAPTAGLIFQTGRATGTGYLSLFKLLGTLPCGARRRCCRCRLQWCCDLCRLLRRLLLLLRLGRRPKWCVRRRCGPPRLRRCRRHRRPRCRWHLHPLCRWRRRRRCRWRRLLRSWRRRRLLCRKRRRPLCVLLCRDGRHHLVGPWLGSWASTRVALCRRHRLRGMACSSLLSAWRRCRRQPTWQAWRSLRRGLHRLRRCCRRRRI
ncbi:uncharacterized protein LOC104585264 isoform X1 [Brachypodium distachyon]|uniref:uncharacterized protein LOC104585264 isoform X1 n=1 Tax=Brachypodium distachyon TaxID=15368 RepID=UPI000D0DF925|nr:uncharacterized protein LOC104585264 isoform X1 [Brachypodium distachyon]|eukprot:XP_024312216.1 uncharacterized protein LOC104585264 isoform X1 [Brachypodium distachyon]